LRGAQKEALAANSIFPYNAETASKSHADSRRRQCNDSEPEFRRKRTTRPAAGVRNAENKWIGNSWWTKNIAKAAEGRVRVLKVILRNDYGDYMALPPEFERKVFRGLKCSGRAWHNTMILPKASIGLNLANRGR
jgi:hypothetical protein